MRGGEISRVRNGRRSRGERGRILRIMGGLRFKCKAQGVEMKERFSEMPDDENKVILYTTDDGKSRVSLMSRDGCV